jgi:hypothetical protein
MAADAQLDLPGATASAVLRCKCTIHDCAKRIYDDTSGAGDNRKTGLVGTWAYTSEPRKRYNHGSPVVLGVTRGRGV